MVYTIYLRGKNTEGRDYPIKGVIPLKHLDQNIENNQQFLQKREHRMITQNFLLFPSFSGTSQIIKFHSS